MFSVYCSWHGTDVLLGPADIVAMHRNDDALQLEWKCTCGNTGVDTIVSTQGKPRTSRRLIITA